MKRTLSFLTALGLVFCLCPAALAAEEALIPYEVWRYDAAPFLAADFEGACRARTGEKLDWVRFTQLPDVEQGSLWYWDEGSHDREVKTGEAFAAGVLGQVRFEPSGQGSGTLSIPFEGEGAKGGRFLGRVEVTVDPVAYEVSYTIDRDERLFVDGEDLDRLCQESTGQGLKYIFAQPPSMGQVYEGDPEENGRKVRYAETFCYEALAGGEGDQGKLVFEPEGPGFYRIPYTAYSTGDRFFESYIRVRVGKDPSGDLNYTAVAGSAVDLDPSKVGNAMRNFVGEDWSGLRFEPPMAADGALFRDYQGKNQRRVTEEDVWTLQNVGELTFVPAAGAASRVRIDFTVKDDEGEVHDGVLLIRYEAEGEPGTVTLECGALPLVLENGDFWSAYSHMGVGGPDSITFTSLPDESQGTLWSRYVLPEKHSGGRVTAGESYDLKNDGVVFVPKAGFRGTVTLHYTTEVAGGRFSGVISIDVVPGAETRFSDMEKAAWAAPAAEFLTQYGVVRGTGGDRFGPAQALSRGDFILMLSRAYGFAEGQGSGGSFADVPAGSYYAPAIAAAKEKGIAQGGGENFYPQGKLTRQDAAVLICRTLEAMGEPLEMGESADLESFKDRDQASEYAVSALAALVRGGILSGSNTGHLDPTGSLSRAEMAVILHRVLTR